MAKEDGRISVEEHDGVALITLDRPHKRNAMNTAMWRSLEERCRELARRDDVRAVVLRGASGTFSAGFDLEEMYNLSLEETERSFQQMERAIQGVEALPMPTIGLLRGVAAGGGCELLLACDLRVAARSARLSMPVARIGLTIGPDFGRRLVRIVGPSRAREMLFTGRFVRATEAYRWGMVNEVAPDEKVEERGLDLARRIAALSAASHRASKAMTAFELAGEGKVRPSASAGEHRYVAAPDDWREGLEAWRERREPVFRREGARGEPISPASPARRPEREVPRS